MPAAILYDRHCSMKQLYKIHDLDQHIIYGFNRMAFTDQSVAPAHQSFDYQLDKKRPRNE